MVRTSIEIPPDLNTRIGEFLLYSGLDHRDKGRAILYAIDQLAGQRAPDELIAICQAAKAITRAKQRKATQEPHTCQ